MVKEFAIKPEAIAAVEIGVNPRAYRQTCCPAEIKNKPRSVVDAQFSTPYSVACAILDGNVTFNHFTEEAIQRADILALLQRTKSYIDPEIEKAFAEKAATSARVRIKMKDGKEFEKKIDIPKGHSQNPMTEEELAEKFRYCAAHAARPIPPRNVEQAIELLVHLEKVEDINQILGLLNP